MIDDIRRYIFLDIMTLFRYTIHIQPVEMRGIMTIDQHTYDVLCGAFSPVPPEAGGILGSVDGCICAFVYDSGMPDMTRNCYTPDVDFLNRVIEQWQSQGITFCGIVHSHPAGQRELSEADQNYIRVILECMPGQINALYFPIVIPGEGVFSYLAQRGTVIASDKITIIKEI